MKSDGYEKKDTNPYEIGSATAIWKEVMWKKESQVLANGPEWSKGLLFGMLPVRFLVLASINMKTGAI